MIEMVVYKRRPDIKKYKQTEEKVRLSVCAVVPLCHFVAVLNGANAHRQPFEAG